MHSGPQSVPGLGLILGGEKGSPSGGPVKLTLAETPLGRRVALERGMGGAFDRVAVWSAKTTPLTANHASVVSESELDEKGQCVSRPDIRQKLNDEAASAAGWRA